MNLSSKGALRSILKTQTSEFLSMLRKGSTHFKQSVYKLLCFLRHIFQLKGQMVDVMPNWSEVQS